MQRQQENAIHNPEESQNQRSGVQIAARSRFRDIVLLFGTALLVCLIGGGVALAFEIYQINQAWFYFAWSSIFLLPLLGKKFRSYFQQPAFVAFFIVWMGVHGATVVGMIVWVPFLLWPLILLLELAAGFFTAHWLFGSPLDQEQQKR
jgi:hypothetical protein